MDVILLKNVEKLGFKSDIVSVKPGYGRNYLIPQGDAILADKRNLKIHDENLRQRAVKNEQLKKDAEKTAKALKKEEIIVIVKAGKSGKIFGSVNTVMLADSIEKLGHKVERKGLKILGSAIKTVGTYEAEARLHRDITTTIAFKVVADSE